MTLLRASLIAAALAFASPGFGADLLLKGGRAYTVSGDVIDGGSVLVTDGRIAAVGTDVAVPEGARVIDVAGKSVCPGFVDTHSHLGVHEEELDEVVAPDATDTLVLDAFWAGREDVTAAAASGVTTLLLSTGASNPVSGYCAAVKADGRVVDERAVLKVSLLRSALLPTRTPTSMPGLLEMVAETLIRAKDEAPGELRVQAFCEGYSQVEHAARLAKGLGLRMSVMAGAVPERLVRVLQGTDVSMVLPPLALVPLEKSLRIPGELSKAGVQVGFSSMAPATDAHDLRTSAAVAVGAGMDETAALRALTLDGAGMIGVAERVGSIEVGKDADLLVIAGDPLDISAPVELVVVEGNIIHEREGL